MSADPGRRLIVTVDGPAGSGKSTLARRLARRAGLRYLESGAFYRAAAWLVQQDGAAVGDPERLAVLLAAGSVQVTAGPDGFLLSVAGQDITGELRRPEITRLASQVAMLRPVRQWVLGHLRALATQGGLVAEGRDMGTRVFPDAEVKIFLDASLAERAHRRWLELQAQGQAVTEAQVREDLAQRDQRDRERAEDPLRVPAGAHRLDSTNYGPAEMEEICFRLIQPFL